MLVESYQFVLLITETSWADVPNWPQMPRMDNDENSKKDKNAKKKNSGKNGDDENEDVPNAYPEPDSPNISWFFEKDADASGTLTLSELWQQYSENAWFNERYQLVLEKFIYEADLNKDRGIDIAEYIKLHENHPWYSEQLAFMLMNTDGNGHLSKQELLEASRASPDMHQLNFGQRQLENLVDGLLAIGDRDPKDGKIAFAEYVAMSRDVFVDNFAPKVFKRMFKD